MAERRCSQCDEPLRATRRKSMVTGEPKGPDLWTCDTVGCWGNLPEIYPHDFE